MTDRSRTFGASRRVLSFSVLGLLAACSAAGSGSSPREDVGAAAQAVWEMPGGTFDYANRTDADSLRANTVVSLASTATGATACTGLLLTPKIVLTAASCKNAAKAGPTPFVRAGGRVPFQQTVQATSFVTLAANPANEPSLSGQDVGLVFLSDYVLTPAQTSHPSLTAPVATAPAAPGGLEPFANVGMAGWSSLDADRGTLAFAQTARQAVIASTVSLWRYGTISPSHEPFWVYNGFTSDGIPKFGLAPGDNGSPLFTVDAATGRRDVFGVASILGDPPDTTVRQQALPAIVQCKPLAGSAGNFTSCTGFVDVTTTAVKTWIASQVVDRTRGATWTAAHPRLADQGTEAWIGDADYGGTCDTATDPDCDHVRTFNANGSLRDNCPDVANTAQIDSDDGSAGDACGCGADVGVHEQSFSSRKVCAALGARDVASAAPLRSLSVPQTRDALACTGAGRSGSCALVQRDWIATGAVAGGIASVAILDRARAVPTAPAAMVKANTSYSDADFATIDMSLYAGDRFNTCYELCAGDARCKALTLTGTTCHLKTSGATAVSASGSTSYAPPPPQCRTSADCHLVVDMCHGSCSCSAVPNASTSLRSLSTLRSLRLQRVCPDPVSCVVAPCLHVTAVCSSEGQCVTSGGEEM
jgi:hypothetical protein